MRVILGVRSLKVSSPACRHARPHRRRSLARRAIHPNRPRNRADASAETSSAATSTAAAGREVTAAKLFHTVSVTSAAASSTRQRQPAPISQPARQAAGCRRAG
jgi:hypothetical protein